MGEPRDADRQFQYNVTLVNRYGKCSHESITEVGDNRSLQSMIACHKKPPRKRSIFCVIFSTSQRTEFGEHDAKARKFTTSSYEIYNFKLWNLQIQAIYSVDEWRRKHDIKLVLANVYCVHTEAKNRIPIKQLNGDQHIRICPWVRL